MEISFTTRKKPDKCQAFFLFVSMAMTMGCMAAPTLAQLFQKDEKLVGFLFGKCGKKLIFAVFALFCFLLSKGGAVFGQVDICGTAVIFAGASADETGVLQFFEYLAGRAGLNAEPLGDIPLGHAAFFLQHVQDVVLGAFVVKVVTALVMELAQKMQKFVRVIHALIVRGIVPSVMRIRGRLSTATVAAMAMRTMVIATRILAMGFGAVAAFRERAGAGIFFASGAVRVIQRAAAAAAGADVVVIFIFRHSIHP